MRVRLRTLLPIVVAFGLMALVATGWGPSLVECVRAQAWNLDIDRAMDAAGVVPGMTVGEAGAGEGYFTLPMARRVGTKGRVYANDISSRALARLADKARREGLANIEVVEGAVDDPLFPRRDLDLVVIVHAFHDFDRPVEWLTNLRKYLRPGATVAIIDLDPDQGADRHFWSRDRILGHTAKAGYETVKVVDDVSRHLIVVLKPQSGL